VRENSGGWYRCRSCGYESLRPLDFEHGERGGARVARDETLGLSLFSTSDT
jgi:hypothetical protein